LLIESSQVRLFFILVYVQSIYIYMYVYMCVRTYHVRNNYVTYTVAMLLRQFRRLLCVAAMSSLPQWRLRDGYREAGAT